MALISCSECGKEISDKAAACPNCGCPIEKIPKGVAIMLENAPLFCWHYNIYSNGILLTQGKSGDVVEFDCLEPMEISIYQCTKKGSPKKLSPEKQKAKSMLSAIVNPGEKYNISRRGFNNTPFLQKVEVMVGNSSIDTIAKITALNNLNNVIRKR